LNDGGDLGAKIEEKLRAADADFTGASVLTQSIQQQVKQTKSRESESNTPTIVLDLTVHGVDYGLLTAASNAADLKQNFAAVVQQAIATEGSVDAKSVALDISDAGKIADVPGIFVTAKFASSAGLSSKEVMSKWPSASMRTSLQQSLQGIAGIAKVSLPAVVAPAVPKIQVSVASPRLGHVRLAYKDTVSLEMSVTGQNTNADDANEKKMKQRLEEAIQSIVNIDATDLTVTKKTNGDPTVFTVSIVSAVKPSWDHALVDAAVEATQKLKGDNPAITAVTAAPLPATVSTAPTTIDVDFVIYGVDASQLSAEKRSSFLKEVAGAVREGIMDDQKITDLGADKPVEDDIDVTLSTGASNTISVQAKVPADTDVNHRDVVVESLEKADFTTRMESKLASIEIMAYIATWTPQAIHVRMPGVPVKESA